MAPSPRSPIKANPTRLCWQREREREVGWWRGGEREEEEGGGGGGGGDLRLFNRRGSNRELEQLGLIQQPSKKPSCSCFPWAPTLAPSSFLFLFLTSGFVSVHRSPVAAASVGPKIGFFLFLSGWVHVGRRRIMDTPQPKRLYQVWKGSNRFFCGGRLIFGPDVASLFLSTFLIAGPSITFCIQVIVKMNTHRKTDSTRESDQTHILGLPVLIVAALVLMLNLISLFLTSSRDPGIVPRNTRPPEFDEAFESPIPSMEWVNGRTHLNLPRTKEVIVDGFVVKVKFCDTCLLYRLPRASHCAICNNCVRKFDHHCPWVGQCIGLRNYRFFYLFISSSTFLCIYVFTFSWLNIIEERKHLGSIWKSITQEITSVLLIIYTFISVWFVGGLTCFHTYLICTNQTTYENFRYRYDKKENPYSKGVVKNFKEVFFSKIPHSLNDFQSWVLEESIEAESFITMDIVRSMDKIYAEMSDKPALDGNMPLPEILQNLDYGGLDDDLKRDNKQGGDAVDLFTFPVLQEPVVQESMEPNEETISQGTAVV